MSLLNFYPLLIALAGFGVATLLSERAMAMLPADTKAMLVDGFRNVRWLNFAGVALYVILVFWSVRIAFIALCVEYTVLGIWSAIRVRNFRLPTPVSTRLIAAMLARALGLVVCAAIFAIRLS